MKRIAMIAILLALVVSGFAEGLSLAFWTMGESRAQVCRYMAESEMAAPIESGENYLVYKSGDTNVRYIFTSSDKLYEVETKIQISSSWDAYVALCSEKVFGEPLVQSDGLAEWMYKGLVVIMLCSGNTVTVRIGNPSPYGE